MFLKRTCAVLLLVAPVLLGQPVVNDGGIVDAASFAGGRAQAPGSLISIFGSGLAAEISQASSIPLSTSLGDVSVMINNIPAPLLLVSPNQINAQLPWNVLGGGATTGQATIVVRRGAASSQPRNFQVGPFSPGLFAINVNAAGEVVGFGTGRAIAINQDGSLAAPAGSIRGFNTRPALRNDPLVILATGLGAVDPPVESGRNSVDALRRATTTPAVLIGGMEARVDFAGLAPEFVGVNQLNVVVPQGVAPGNSVPLQIRVGGITTTEQVTIAVQ